MNHYLEPVGFLGTGASLAADLTLIAYLLLIIPGMLAGWYFARQGHHRPAHKWTMITITVVNTILILGLMVFAYRFDVVDNIGLQPNNFRYLMPTIHAVFGLPAQILAIIIVLNMLNEDRSVALARQRGETELSKYWWKHAKPIMRLTIVLWLITATFGVVSYLIRYDVLSVQINAGDILPVATEEVVPTDIADPVVTEEPVQTQTPEPVTPAGTEPIATEEVDVQTVEPVATEEMNAQSVVPVVTEAVDAPVMTEEPTGMTIMPVVTEETDDDSGRGRGRGRGRGGDDDDDDDDDD